MASLQVMFNRFNWSQQTKKILSPFRIENCRRFPSWCFATSLSRQTLLLTFGANVGKFLLARVVEKLFCFRAKYCSSLVHGRRFVVIRQTLLRTIDSLCASSSRRSRDTASSIATTRPKALLELAPDG
ncbi:hypothetical protein CGZ80_05530 [Rhodopirellula sp. MGV]|nr:hypothetical protein CGZ80_05530 [Rhodopirellula sp. MGV]